jgi:hypothetical protein
MSSGEILIRKYTKSTLEIGHQAAWLDRSKDAVPQVCISLKQFASYMSFRRGKPKTTWITARLDFQSFLGEASLVEVWKNITAL